MFKCGTEALVLKSIIINVFVFAHIRSIYFRFDLLLLILHHRGNSYRRGKKADLLQAISTIRAKRWRCMCYYICTNHLYQWQFAPVNLKFSLIFIRFIQSGSYFSAWLDISNRKKLLVYCIPSKSILCVAPILVDVFWFWNCTLYVRILHLFVYELKISVWLKVFRMLKSFIVPNILKSPE